LLIKPLKDSIVKLYAATARITGMIFKGISFNYQRYWGHCEIVFELIKIKRKINKIDFFKNLKFFSKFFFLGIDTKYFGAWING